MAIPNGLNPTLTAVTLGASAVICSGVAATPAAVATDVAAQCGDVGNGSLYLSQAAGKLYMKVSGTYTSIVSF